MNCYTIRYHQDQWVVYWETAIWFPIQQYFDKYEDAERWVNRLNSLMVGQ